MTPADVPTVRAILTDALPGWTIDVPVNSEQYGHWFWHDGDRKVELSARFGRHPGVYFWRGGAQLAGWEVDDRALPRLREWLELVGAVALVTDGGTG